MQQKVKLCQNFTFCHSIGVSGGQKHNHNSVQFFCSHITCCFTCLYHKILLWIVCGHISGLKGGYHKVACDIFCPEKSESIFQIIHKIHIKMHNCTILSKAGCCSYCILHCILSFSTIPLEARSKCFHLHRDASTNYELIIIHLEYLSCYIIYATSNLHHQKFQT